MTAATTTIFFMSMGLTRRLTTALTAQMQPNQPNAAMSGATTLTSPLLYQSTVA